MSLAPGTRLGPYEIESPAGAGGMGEVYKARDTRLNRTVAVKVSRERFSERFEREARAIAALNHPHICTLFDVGPDYLVMEFVVGRPIEGPLPLKTALPFAAQIAGALHAAHSKGVIHRDLKPGNILVTKAGVKLLDFGLAKVAGQAAAAGDPTATATLVEPLTKENAILGTLQYMAPEQLEGKPADARTDIFAFGLVLYEALTGKPAFQAKSQASLIASIMKEEPVPLTTAESVTPPALERLLRKCLAKDPDARWQSAADLRDELDWIAVSSTPVAALPAVTRSVSRAKWTPAAIVLALAIGLAAGIFWPRAPKPVQWTGKRLGGPVSAVQPAISPDGQLVAFGTMVAGNLQLAVMKADGSSWSILTHQNDLGYVGDIAWSTDGSQIYFSRFFDQPRGLFSIPALGGEPRLLLEDTDGGYPLGDGSMIAGKLAAQGDIQLIRFWPETGRTDALPAFTARENDIMPVAVFPGGKEIAFHGVYSTTQDHGADFRLYALDLESRKARALGPSLGSWPVPPRPMAASADGKSLITVSPAEDLVQIVRVPRDGSATHEVLFSIPSALSLRLLSTGRDGSVYLDLVDRPRTVVRFPTSGGEPEELLQLNVISDLQAVLPGGRFVLSGRGSRRELTVVNPGGEFRPLVSVNEESGAPLAVSSNGMAALAVGNGNQQQIAIASIREARIRKRLALKAADARSIALSPDGNTLYYAAKGAVFALPTDESAAPRRIAEGEQIMIDPQGRFLYVKQLSKNPGALVRVPVTGGAVEPIPLPPGIRLTEDPLCANAVDAQGRVLIEIATPESYFFGTALYDPARGAVTRVPVRFEGDLWGPCWTPDGAIVLTGAHFASSIWRYHK
jgi:eukaryotic-like serine/threonine-protein kinase